LHLAVPMLATCTVHLITLFDHRNDI
jgi:hypothetical protein